MFVTILVILIFVSLIAVLVLGYSNKDNKKSWIQFYAKGKDAGFSLKEIDLLRRLAVKNALSDPTALFWSQDKLDTCIRNIVRNARLSGGGDRGIEDFLSKLYDYRKKIEMQRPRIKNGISDSRQVEEGQSLRILLKGYGVFPSRILKNTGHYLTIARPSSTKLPLSFSWTGASISVYFWRDDDAGYVFDTEVEDEVFSKGNSALKIKHGTNLCRTQKRASIRLKTHKAAYFYMLEDDEPSQTIEMVPGHKCFVEDISDTGCGILIGGKTAEGLRVKVQFILNNAPVCISGTVKSVEFNEEKKQSLLHVEADPMNTQTRNLIMGEVFGMLPEEVEELPFRVLDEEAEAHKADNYSASDADTGSGTSAIADSSL